MQELRKSFLRRALSRPRVRRFLSSLLRFFFWKKKIQRNFATSVLSLKKKKTRGGTMRTLIEMSMLVLAATMCYHLAVWMLHDRTLMSCAAELPVEDSWNLGSTLLMRASGKGRLDCVQALVATPGVDVDEFSGPGNALMIAVANGNVDCAEALLRAGANVNATRRDNATALHAAAVFGHLSCLTVLLRAGADVNAVDRYNMSALALAVFNGHSASSVLLLAAGGDPTRADSRGRTPAMIAAVREEWEWFGNYTT
jgi:hypothetical protein